MSEGQGRVPSRARSRRRTALRALLVAALVVAVGAAAWWAGRATLLSALQDREEDPAAAIVWAQAQPGSVGRTLPVSVTVRQPVEAVAENMLSGVVTEVNTGEVDQGAVVFVVGATPVRVVQGDRPFWRELASGASGTDVEMLQQALADLGFLSTEPDGRFGPATAAAVREWQRELGQEATGTIALGELIALRTLPAEVQVGEDIRTGSTVSGGEAAILAPADAQDFVMVLTDEQSRLIPQDAAVQVSHGELSWDAVISSSEINANGQTELTLAAPDGGVVCGDECDTLPADPEVTLRSQVVIVPPVEGISIPAAAVQTRADGTTFVQGESGDIDVEVLGSGQGIAIVEGLADGDRVALPQGSDSQDDGNPATDPGEPDDPTTTDGSG